MSKAALARVRVPEHPRRPGAIHFPFPTEYSGRDRGFLIETGPQPEVSLAFSRVRDTIQRFQWQLTEEAVRRNRVVEQLCTARKFRDIAILLEGEGHGKSAARVRRLLALATEEKDDGEKEPQIDSLRSLARFLLLEIRELPRPTLALGPLGLFTAEWNARPSGGMILQFVSDDEIQFTGVANIRESDPPYQEISCTFSRDKALEALSLFAKDPQIDFAGANPLF